MEQGESQTPQFIRDFSKKQSPEEYNKTVQTLKKKREEFHQKREERRNKQENLQVSTTERQETLDQTLTELRSLRDHIDELSTSGLKRLFNYFKLRKIKADMEVGEKTYQELKQQQNSEISQQQKTVEGLKTPPELQEARNILNNFYQIQKEKWSTGTSSKEDIKKYFTEEHLSSLSLQDYILLLQRFPSEMVTHVTRQGIRDHIGMSFHTVGKGKYFDGFIKIIEDGRLRSPLGIQLVQQEKEKAIANFLYLDKFQTKEEALTDLSSFTKFEIQGLSGSYVDRAAIHFATEEVADCYYGSEKGNEIFLVYPSALIASQYYFNGQLNKNGGGYWNDQWVWANEEHGININAGVVFIPSETQVDQKTGSRYQLDDNNNPIINSEYQSLFRKVVDSPDFNEFAEQVMAITGHLSLNANLSLIESLRPFRQKLEVQFNIKDKRLQNAIMDYGNLFNIIYIPKQNENDPLRNTNSQIEEALQKEGILFLESQDTTDSKNFWENYFSRNPQQRPSKIVYYENSNPTTALQQWKRKNRLTKTSSDEYIGFEEQSIQRDNSFAIAGIDRFRTLAENIIDDYFSQPRNITA